MNRHAPRGAGCAQRAQHHERQRQRRAVPGAAEGPYDVREFDLTGVTGLSPRAIELHLDLYAGYVTHLNKLLAEQTAAFPAPGEAATPLDLTSHARRFAFEYNGVMLHELFFEALGPTGAGSPDKSGALADAAARTFGGITQWMQHAAGTGATARDRLGRDGTRACHEPPVQHLGRPASPECPGEYRHHPRARSLGACVPARLCAQPARNLFRDGVVKHRLAEGRKPLSLNGALNASYGEQSKDRERLFRRRAAYYFDAELKPTAEM